MSITILQGDLLAQPVDAIVNPANGFLNHGAGLARKIADAACDDGWAREGRPPAAELKQKIADARTRSQRWRLEQHQTPTIPTGGAAVTSAGNLPFKGVIHAVGPVWAGGSLYERELLGAAHSSALTAALERDWSSVALPAISCGLFRFPVELAAPIAIRVAAKFPLDVTFALFEDDHFAAYSKAVVESGAQYRIVVAPSNPSAPDGWTVATEPNGQTYLDPAGAKP